MRLSRPFLCSFLVLVAGSSLRAEECTPNPEKPLFEFLQDCVVGQDITRKAEAETKEAVTEMATSAAAPEGFADRVNDTIADFLPLLQFAVNGVTTSDDKKSVTVNFNSPPILMGCTALKATAAEPQFFPKLEEKIVEGARVAQAKRLLGKAGDFSDITYSFDWGLRLTAGNWRTTRHLYGREFETYEGLIEELAAAAIHRFQQAKTTSQFQNALVGVTEDLNKAAGAFKLSLQAFATDTPYGELERLVADESDPVVKITKAEALAKAVASIRGFAEQEAAARLRVPNLDAIDSLIANQPELILKASYRNADEVVGQKEEAYTFSYEMGTYNFNRVLREYRKRFRQRPATALEPDEQEDGDLKLTAFETVSDDPLAKAENRFAFTGTYKRFSGYHFRHSYEVETVDGSGMPVTSDQLAELTIPSSAEFHLKILYSRPVRSFLGGEPPADGDASLPQGLILPSEKRSRIDFSLEGVWVDEDRSIAEELRRKDRVIGRLTFTHPLPNGMSIPFSIVYANRSELLAEERDLLSAHVAISYKFLKASDLPK